MTDRLIPLRTVIAQAGIGKTSIYAFMAAGQFPRFTRVGARVLWSEAEVQQWVAARLAAREARTA